MNDSPLESRTQTALPKFAGAGWPQFGRRLAWWLWIPLIFLILAVTPLVLVRWGPASLQAQVTDNPVSAVSRQALGEPPAPDAPPPASATTADAPPAGNDLTPQLRHGLSLVADGKLVEGRAVLSDLYFSAYAQLTPEDAQAIRDTLWSVNQQLVFDAKVTADDPLAEVYVVQPGDVLTRVTLKYKVPYPLIEQINNTPANRIRAGQRLKMIRGPLHALVHKREFRLDVFAHGPDGMPLYIRSFPVGLGEEDSTPPGTWVLSGKVQNPAWTNPRTHQHFTADDPANPIGEFWIGLQGLDENTRGKRGYGIHGTIEPQSIGRTMSMGCIRLRHEDIALLYKLLYDKLSTVKIEP